MQRALVVTRYAPTYAKRFVPAFATLAGRTGVGPLSLFPTKHMVHRSLMVHTPGFLWREYDFGFPEMKRMSPHYEITDTNEEFKVSVTVPKDLKADDISVNINSDYLKLSGETKTEEEDYKSHFKFMQTFSIDPAIEKDKFEATLKDGKLTIAAPKDPARIESQVQNIPVIQLENTEAKEEAIKVEKDTDINKEDQVA